jgi:hypothetical protein
MHPQLPRRIDVLPLLRKIYLLKSLILVGMKETKKRDAPN